MRVLFSPRLMFWALALLNVGCLLRVVSKIPAYEVNLALAWNLLPISAITEFSAVTLFVMNMLVTFARPPAHLAAARFAA
jgi:hypothetical protein